MHYDGSLDSSLNPMDPGQAVLFGMDGGGRELIDEQIRSVLRRKGRCLVLEVGSFVGHSASRWLQLDERVRLICSDFFQFDSGYLRDLYGKGEPWVVEQLTPEAAEMFFAGLDLDWGQLRMFLLNLQRFRSRIEPFIGDFSATAFEISEYCQATHQEVDIVYLDADKGYETLVAARRLFPAARLMGDDWEFRSNEGFPIQLAVQRFCKENCFYVKTRQATWVLHTCSRLRLRSRLRRVAARLKAWVG